MTLDAYRRSFWPKALFVDPKGIYPKLLGAENCWDESRDAREFRGPGPVVAHPPCQLWTARATVNFKRYPKEKNRPAYAGGDDGGCFAFAVAAARAFGGVVEHPAQTRAWGYFGLPTPERNRWTHFSWSDSDDPGLGHAAVCEVSQCAYGHRARKRTWLLYSGKRPPFELDWLEPPYTHQIGHDSKMKRPRPSLGKREACATPRAFAEVLIHLAEWSKDE